MQTMGKLKPHKGLLKRVKVTGTGKLLRSKPGRRHLLSNKSGKTLRQMRRQTGIAKSEVNRMKTLMGKR